MKKYLMMLSCLFACLSIHAQLSTNEEPISFKRSFEIDTKQQVDIKTMPALNLETITREDLEDE